MPSTPEGATRAFLNRPDHLTRVAQEAARSDEVVQLADAVELRRDLPLTQVELDAGPTGSPLDDSRNAADVATAIRRAVDEVRRHR